MKIPIVETFNTFTKICVPLDQMLMSARCGFGKGIEVWFKMKWSYFFLSSDFLRYPDKYDIYHEESRRNQAKHFYARKVENGSKWGFGFPCFCPLSKLNIFFCLVNVWRWIYNSIKNHTLSHSYLTYPSSLVLAMSF